jgi:hypothetical protein
MKSDEPPCHDHRRYVEQFIRKRPPEGSHEQLEQIRCYRNRIGKLYTLSCENGGLEYVQECLRHLVKRLYRTSPNIEGDLSKVFNTRAPLDVHAAAGIDAESAIQCEQRAELEAFRLFGNLAGYATRMVSSVALV